MDLMTEKLVTLNANFAYKADGFDSWRILSDRNLWIGDCDDYAVTALWHLSDKSVAKFLWNLLTFRCVFWLVISPKGDLHVRLHYKQFWLCNIRPEPSATCGMTRIFPFITPVVIVKMLLGKLTG